MAETVNFPPEPVDLWARGYVLRTSQAARRAAAWTSANQDVLIPLCVFAVGVALLIDAVIPRVASPARKDNGDE